jgi:hypothetical protein
MIDLLTSRWVKNEIPPLLKREIPKTFPTGKVFGT